MVSRKLIYMVHSKICKFQTAQDSVMTLLYHWRRLFKLLKTDTVFNLWI